MKWGPQKQTLDDHGQQIFSLGMKMGAKTLVCNSGSSISPSFKDISMKVYS
jgi:hypothetical protein